VPLLPQLLPAADAAAAAVSECCCCCCRLPLMLRLLLPPLLPLLLVQYIALLLQHTSQFLGGNPPYLSILVSTYMGLATKVKRCFPGNI
jgi:hypothetical protein